jgi:hypothetical protein
VLALNFVEDELQITRHDDTDENSEGSLASVETTLGSGMLYSVLGIITQNINIQNYE